LWPQTCLVVPNSTVYVSFGLNLTKAAETSSAKRFLMPNVIFWMDFYWFGAEKWQILKLNTKTMQECILLCKIITTYYKQARKWILSQKKWKRHYFQFSSSVNWLDEEGTRVVVVVLHEYQSIKKVVVHSFFTGCPESNLSSRVIISCQLKTALGNTCPFQV
jgi:hypothetical protein